MATVGQVLTSPESGWRRYNDNDSRILYAGTWTYDTSSSGTYSSSQHYTNISGGTIKFKFYGTKLRILAARSLVRSNSIKIEIDSIVETFSEYGTPSAFQVLMYEKIGLPLGVHNVTITLLENNYLDFDAIDIDDTGYLVHPTLNQVSNLVGIAEGDCIPCRYTATSGVVGTFSELGTCMANEIPVTGTATPDGLFYLIKTAKGTLVADRPVQTNITWDVLNSSGFIEGKIMLLDITDQKYLIDDGHYGSRNLCFDNKIDTYMVSSWEADISDKKGWVGQLFPLPKVIVLYSVSATSDVPTNSPIDWTFEGSNDGTNWTELHRVTGASWTASETKYFNINNNTLYMYYRINITNSGGSGYAIIAEIEMAEYNNKVLIHSLSGGCAYADANGNKSITDSSKGGWPVTNEWDKYIVNSDLGGKITPGDNNLWHWSGMASWCKETPISSINSNTCRILRGNQLENKFNASLSNYPFGFRPVLEYIESDSKQTNLWY